MTPEQTFSALQRVARQEGRAVQELLTLYVLERFLARLVESPARTRSSSRAESSSPATISAGRLGMLICKRSTSCSTRSTAERWS